MRIKSIARIFLDKFFLNNKDFMWYIHTRVDPQTYIVLEKKYLQNLYTEYNRFKFSISEHLETPQQVLEDYDFSDIRPTDIVLDIGACIGAFSLYASLKAKQIIAVEPLFPEILRKNIELNDIKNISIIEAAIGDFGVNKIRFGCTEKEIHFIPLSQIIKTCIKQFGQPTFLKCDCEGGEWSIKPDDLYGIRRIEMEIHSTQKWHNDGSPILSMLGSAGFTYTAKKVAPELTLVHAKKKA